MDGPQVKKYKCENINNYIPEMCKIMGEFQTWPQNSNHTFDPFFDKKKSEIDKILSAHLDLYFDQSIFRLPPQFAQVM